MGASISYRSDLYSEVRNFGTYAVDRIDSSEGKAAYPISFGGLLLRTKGANKTFGFFSDKFVCAGQTRNGEALGDDARVSEVNRLAQWISSKMDGHPKATRIVTTDMNAARGSRPWQAFKSGWSDGDYGSDHRFVGADVLTPRLELSRPTAWLRTR